MIGASWLRNTVFAQSDLRMRLAKSQAFDAELALAVQT